MGETHDQASYAAFEVRLCGRPLPELHALEARLVAWLRDELSTTGTLHLQGDIEIELLETAEPRTE